MKVAWELNHSVQPYARLGFPQISRTFSHSSMRNACFGWGGMLGFILGSLSAYAVLRTVGSDWEHHGSFDEH